MTAISACGYIRHWRMGFETGHPKVVILGSDSPTLPEEHLRFLLNGDADVALGPTVDGGYYGIGCRRVAPSMSAGCPMVHRQCAEGYRQVGHRLWIELCAWPGMVRRGHTGRPWSAGE